LQRSLIVEEDILIEADALVEKRLSLAHQNCLSLAHFGSPVTYMPAVMLTAGAFGLCAGDKKQYRWRIWLVRRG
jgi:hypothetical protein